MDMFAYRKITNISYIPKLNLMYSYHVSIDDNNIIWTFLKSVCTRVVKSCTERRTSRWRSHVGELLA